MEPWATEKKLYATLAVPPAPVRFLAMATCPECYASDAYRSMIRIMRSSTGAAHRPSGIYLTAEENPGKLC